MRIRILAANAALASMVARRIETPDVRAETAEVQDFLLRHGPAVDPTRVLRMLDPLAPPTRAEPLEDVDAELMLGDPLPLDHWNLVLVTDSEDLAETLASALVQAGFRRPRAIVRPVESDAITCGAASPLVPSLLAWILAQHGMDGVAVQQRAGDGKRITIQVRDPRFQGAALARNAVIEIRSDMVAPGRAFARLCVAEGFLDTRLRRRDPATAGRGMVARRSRTRSCDSRALRRAGDAGRTVHAMHRERSGWTCPGPASHPDARSRCSEPIPGPSPASVAPGDAQPGCAARAGRAHRTRCLPAATAAQNHVPGAPLGPGRIAGRNALCRIPGRALAGTGQYHHVRCRAGARDRCARAHGRGTDGPGVHGRQGMGRRHRQRLDPARRCGPDSSCGPGSRAGARARRGRRGAHADGTGDPRPAHYMDPEATGRARSGRRPAPCVVVAAGRGRQRLGPDRRARDSLRGAPSRVTAVWPPASRRAGPCPA
jgi:hypothetical protein